MSVFIYFLTFSVNVFVLPSIFKFIFLLFSLLNQFLSMIWILYCLVFCCFFILFFLLPFSFFPPLPFLYNLPWWEKTILCLLVLIEQYGRLNMCYPDKDEISEYCHYSLYNIIGIRAYVRLAINIRNQEKIRFIL